MGEGEKTVTIMKKIARMNGKKVHLEMENMQVSTSSKVPDAIYGSVLSLAEKQKLERANT